MFKDIFLAIIVAVGGAMSTVILLHDRIPRWQGWIAMGASLLAVAVIGYADAVRILRMRERTT